MDGLSDRAWRTFTGSLMWSNEAGTDGQIPRRALRFLHPEGVNDATSGELITAGIWAETSDGIEVRDWVANGQEMAEVIEFRKEQARIRQQNWRDKQKPKDPKPALSAPDVTNDTTGDVTRDVGQEQDRRQRQKTEVQALDGEAPTAVRFEDRERGSGTDLVGAAQAGWARGYER